MSHDDTTKDRPHKGLPEAPEEVLSTMRRDGTRRWMYPTLNKGAMYRKRQVVGWSLILLFFALPIIKIGGLPSVWIDVIHRRFIILGQVFYATDTALLMLLAITSLFAIAWLTALFGRVWCGWGCPQTVYMELVFRPIERLVEGKASKRARRDKGERDAEWFKKKILKYVLFSIVSVILAHNFVAYFISWDILREWMVHSPAENWGVFVLTFGTTALVLFDFAYFREQMCTIACPYARLQSVLLDDDSLIVSYDAGRGEPRGKKKKKRAPDASEPVEVLGDCVDCFACVRACPTGIDIRDGLQLECIGCTQCIDACDGVMAALARPGGLVRYTSERALKEEKVSIFRPRVLVYTLLLLITSSLLAWGISRSNELEVDVTRVPGAPFMLLPDGEVANRVKLHLLNRTQDRLVIAPDAIEPKGASVRVVGRPSVALDPGASLQLEVWVVAKRASFNDGRAEARLTLMKSKDEGVEDITFSLIGPDNFLQPLPPKE